MNHYQGHPFYAQLKQQMLRFMAAGAAKMAKGK
jgi:hypothetical protein